MRSKVESLKTLGPIPVREEMGWLPSIVGKTLFGLR